MALDPSYFFYSDGTITLTSGSDIATGDLVVWDVAVLPFDLVFPAGGQGVSVIQEVLSANQIRLAAPWPGPTLTNVPYFVVRWVKHTDPKVYALRVSEYLTRVKPLPEVGPPGWNPVLAVVADGARRVLRVVDWITTGTTYGKPDVGLYIGATGLVANIAQAVDIRGGTGPQGVQGIHGGGLTARYAYSSTITAADPGAGKLRGNNATFASSTRLYVSNTNGSGGDFAPALDTFDDSTNTSLRGHIQLTAENDPSKYAIFAVTGATTIATGYRTIVVSPVNSSGTFANNDNLVLSFVRTGNLGGVGPQGNQGWSPVLSIVTDGARRVLQVTDWTGGAGTKPATGDYVGATGLVTDIAAAIDIRGPAGPPVAAKSIDNTLLADMPAATLKGNLNPATGAAADLPLLNVGVALGGMGSPRAHYYGGQLRALHKGLTNPLEQFTGIVLIGDSITWGSGASNTAVSTPRGNALTDPRDNFASKSWANELKRYIGATYFRGAAPTLTNWSGSPSGQSTATYKRSLLLFPGKAPFTIVQTGTSVSTADVQDAGAKLGHQRLISDGNTTGTSVSELMIPNFTGDKLALWYTAGTDSGDYQLLVDGVSQGTFSTNGAATAYQQRREHTFTFVREKNIVIRLARRTNVGVWRLRLEAIEVEKTCAIVNNGIIGQSARNYPTGAVPNAYTYVLIQLGTNDRVKVSSDPSDPLTFKANLKAQVDAVGPSYRKTVLMAANPAVSDDPATYGFGMSEARDMIRAVAEENSWDMVDNYAAFTGVDLAAALADGLHPNDFGHAIIARNVIGALEQA